jgi:hypothetical protein
MNNLDIEETEIFEAFEFGQLKKFQILNKNFKNINKLLKQLLNKMKK